jgi:hypothetical protein
MRDMWDKDKERSGCLESSELASLLYSEEMTDAESVPLEEHLAGCSTCTYEFAALAEARLSAYEWNRDEFAHLATPQVVITHNEPAVTAGYFDRILAGLSVLTQFGTAASIGLAAIAVVTGYFLLQPADELGVAETRPPIAVSQPAGVQPNSTVSARPVETAVIDDPSPVRKLRPAAVPASVTKIHRSAEHPSEVAAESKKATRIKSDSLVAQQQSAPRLTNSAEVSDNSLRLADLFSELDVNE